MPGIDDELDQLLAEPDDAAEFGEHKLALPPLKTPPLVKDVLNKGGAAIKQASSAIDSELDALLAEPDEEAPAPAPAPAPVPAAAAPEAIPQAPQAPAKKPWYESLARGAGNMATLGWGDEAVGKISEMLPQPNDPEGYTRRYAAGSQAEDAAANERREVTQARQDNPGAFLAGEALGGAPAAVAGSLAAPGLAGAAGLGAATGAAMGSGTAKKGERVRGGVVGGLEGGLLGGALHGMGEGLKNTAKAAIPTADRLLTQVFMSPTQRAAYQARKGPTGLAELGADVREAGLTAPRNWLDYFRPATASRVAENAARVMEESGANIGRFEQNLVDAGINPEVNISPVVRGLREAAEKTRAVPDLEAGKTAATLERQADLLAQPESVAVAGKMEAPPSIPEWAKTPQPPALPPRPAPVQTEMSLPQADVPATTPVRPPGVQQELSLPRPMPEMQTSFDLSAPPAPRAPGVQLEIPTPRQQPLSQGAFDFGPTQGGLDFDQTTITRAAPASGGSAQAPLFTGTDPVRPPPSAPAQPAPLPPKRAPEQLGFGAQQTSLQLPKPAQKTWKPAGFEATQTDIGPQQLSMKLPEPLPKAPAPEPWRAGELQGEQQALNLPNPNRGPQPENSTPLNPAQAQIQREFMPFDEAVATKRFLADRVNWQKSPNARPQSYGADQARKATWQGMKEQINRALQNDPNVDQSALLEYFKSNKNFSTAAQAYDPALRLAERQNEVGLGMSDLLAGAAVGGGAGGGLAAMANRTARGMGPATASSVVRAGGKVAGAAAPAFKAAGRVAPAMATRKNETPEDVKKELWYKQIGRRVGVLK